MMLTTHAMSRKVLSICLSIILALFLAFGSTLTWSMVSPSAQAFAATGPQPGQPAYYNARWAECEAKVGWVETGLAEWNGTAVQPTQGTGTPDDPYLVKTPEEFRWCLTNQKSCQLQNDLDLGGRSGQNWTDVSARTAWVIDGNGHTVYNLYSYAATHTGLIGDSAHADFVLKNLTVSNAKINSTTTYGAPLIAQFAGGQVLDCAVKNALVWQDNATSGVWAVMSGCVSFGGNGTGGYALPITNKVVRNTHTDNVHVYGGGCSAGFIEAAQPNTLIENCYAINGTLIVPGGHSGGFGSCDTGPVTYRNCFTNIDVYGNTKTGVFQGVVHGGTHTFENCYASGKIEGTDTIGGFIGAYESGGPTSFTNCYSTSMVGMSSGGRNMGGFAGLGENMSFTNCYAAGEVGTLRSYKDGTPLDEHGSPLRDQKVTGFAGDNKGTLTNCFYDKQTTGMCDNGIVSGRVTGLLTRDLIKGEGFADVVDDNGDPVWVFSEGGYPELAVFSKADDAIARASSVASAATVHLYAAEDGTDYDTVRHIRYVFPLTNNANSGKSNYAIAWNNYVGEDPENPLYPNISPILDGDIPIVSLADVGRSDNVSSVAPGIGWLQINATESKSGAVGMRRLRLVPTTAIAMASFGASGLNNADVVTSLPSVNLDGMKVPSDSSIRYDHRDTINFVTTTSTALNSFLLDESTDSKEDKLEKHKITSVDFPKDAASTIGADGTLTYELGSTMDDDELHVTLYKQNEEGEFEPIPWTPELEQLFSGERTATEDDRGVYQLGYEWTNAGATVLKAQGAKTVNIAEPAYVVYHWNDGVHTDEDESSDDSEVYKIDPGCYLVGTTLGDNIVPVPERHGYTVRYWAQAPEGEFAEDGSLTNEMTATTQLHAGRNDVYAVWVPNKHAVEVRDDAGNVIASDPDVDFDTNLTDIMTELGAPEKLKDPDTVVGWTTTPGGSTVTVDDETTMPDENVVLYPVRKAVPQMTKTVKNQTHATGENNVGDLLTYTITATNAGPANSAWQNALIADRLPAGISYVAGSLRLVAPDGTSTVVSDTAYDEASHAISYQLPTVTGAQTYQLVFTGKINSLAIDVSDDEDGADHRDIGNLATGSGQGSDGTNIEPIVTDKAYPNPDPESDTTPGSHPGSWVVTPFDPSPSVEKEVINITDATGPTQVGDTLEVTVTIKNDAPDSVWDDVVITDPIPSGTHVVPGSIKLIDSEGHEIELPDEVFDPTTGTLTYEVGPLGGGEEYELVYEVVVDEDAVGKPLEFDPVTAIGETPHGEEAEVTSGDPTSPAYPTEPNVPIDTTVYWGDPAGHINKTAENLTRPGEQTRVGDTLRYTLVAQNSNTSSKWVDVVLFDELPTDLTPNMATAELVLPSGERVAVSPDAYDANTHRIAVYVGDLYGKEQAMLIFEAQVSENAAGADIGNVGAAQGGTDLPGGAWISKLLGSGENGAWMPGDAFTPAFADKELPEGAIATDPVYPHEMDAISGVLALDGTEASPLTRLPRTFGESLENTLLAPTGDPLGAACTVLGALVLAAGIMVGRRLWCRHP